MSIWDHEAEHKNGFLLSTRDIKTVNALATPKYDMITYSIFLHKYTTVKGYKSPYVGLVVGGGRRCILYGWSE